MEIVVDFIPGGALFYEEYADDLFKVKIYLEDQKIVAPIYGYGPNSEDQEFEVERNINHLLPYVHDVRVKRILLENLIVDARLELDAYDEELNSASPEELTLIWEPRDRSKWWTLLYLSKREVLQYSKYEAQRNLNKYEKMLNDLPSDDETPSYIELMDTEHLKG
ncbi:hypothetical protein IM700_008795 [Paenibacillus sp. DXFW5]|uniref:Uncharacterized protein n=1 Tax=Paenibacillus rhizolycopersici TaxID=2780073 RepID=A0ABS2H4N4_9BACL|nr:hypothetical protein [Paenibacillus rhizolycopersici]MBM6995763.1 hypothetical protein [Paenibacillus rhizolycopersici]